MAGNSFQSPVSGEPSLGTGHYNSTTTKSSVLVVNSGGVSTASTWSAPVTMTGVPVGVKATWNYARVSKAAATPILAVAPATGYTLSDIATSSNNLKYWTVTCVAAGQPAIEMIKIHLDAFGQFRWCTDLGAVTIQIGSAVDYEM